MCNMCKGNSNCTCKCKGDSLHITEQHAGDDERGRSQGSRTVTICKDCKHYVKIAGGGGCCGGALIGPLALLFEH